MSHFTCPDLAGLRLPVTHKMLIRGLYRRSVADGIKAHNRLVLSEGGVRGYLGGPSATTSVLTGGKQEDQRQGEKVTGKQRLRGCTVMVKGLGAEACSLEAAKDSP